MSGFDQTGAQIYTDGGPVLADFDRDGDVDLFLPRLHASARLYENDGAGYFDDVTATRGLELNDLRQGSNSGLFLDFNNDGAIDLVVGLKNQMSTRLPQFRGRSTELSAAASGEPRLQEQLDAASRGVESIFARFSELKALADGRRVAHLSSPPLPLSAGSSPSSFVSTKAVLRSSSTHCL